MEIMGGLLKLGASNHIPVPWFMRSHLGLQTGTPVYLALTSPHLQSGNLPDIIVSPLNPKQFHQTTSVSITVPESVGALHSVLSELRPQINLALADSVTIEGRRLHRVNFVLEPTAEKDSKIHLRHVDEFLQRYAAGANYRLLFERVAPEHQTFKLCQKFEVDAGMIKSDAWLARIHRDYADVVDEFDLSMLVVSSNPDKRLLRYIIPRKGAFSLYVPHEDEPGALKAISERIAACGYNILASRLSRTPPPGSGKNVSVFVAECEPSRGQATDAQHLKLEIERIRKHGIFDVRVHKGRNAQSVVYPNRPRTRHAELEHPDVIRKLEELERSTRQHGARKVVFISRRFLENWEEGEAKGLSEFNGVVDAIREGIEKAGWTWIEATPVVKEERAYADIYARLWHANRFIVLAFDGNGGVDLSPPQGHELGFACGQARRYKIVLPERKHRDFKFANQPDSQLLTYKFPLANRGSDSLATKIQSWLTE